MGYVSLRGKADQLQAALTENLQSGQRELEAGKAALQQANAKHDTTLVNEAIVDFTTAKSDFEFAAEQADNSSFLRYLEYAPSVGHLARSRHNAVDAIAEMGSAISDAGVGLSQLDGEIIKPTQSGEAGKTLLTVLDQVHAGLAGVRANLQAAQRAARQVDMSIVPLGQQAAFINARTTIDSALAGFAEFERLYPVLTEVLGGNGVRRYLIEQVNPAELRAGGGFIGTYSLLQADHGSLTIARSGDSYDLANPRPFPGQPGFIPWPGPFREVDRTISWSFVDSNEFPDFATNAEAGANFAQPRLGNLDGVISIDYYVVVTLLGMTGPLAVPGYGITVTADNFLDQTIHLDLANNPAHKAIVNALAGPLMSRIASLPANAWPNLVAALNQLASQRHIQVYLRDKSAETEIDRVGWSGATNPMNAADYMLEVESNYGGGKSNYFVTRTYSLMLSRSGDTLHHSLSIDYTNSGACASEVNATYRATVRMYGGLTSSSSTGNLRPVSVPYSDAAVKSAVAVGWLPLVYCNGGRAHVVINYDTSWPANERIHRIYWQKQPGILNDHIVVTWVNDAGRRYSAVENLDQDRMITLAQSSITLSPALSGQAVLPILSF